MKIEIISRCRVEGKEYFPGDIVDTTNGIANDRIGMGLAKKYVEPPPPAPVDEDAVVSTAPPGQIADGEAVAAPEGKPKKGKKGAE